MIFSVKRVPRTAQECEEEVRAEQKGESNSSF